MVGFGSQRGNVTARPHTSSSEAVMIFRGQPKWSEKSQKNFEKNLKNGVFLVPLGSRGPRGLTVDHSTEFTGNTPF